MLPRRPAPPLPRPRSLVEVADWPEKRAEMIARYANHILDSGKAREPITMS